MVLYCALSPFRHKEHHMIATLEITNSYISIGCMQDNRPLFLERISTNLRKTDLEYAVDLLQTFTIHRLEITDIEGCVLASVVPKLTSVFTLSVRRVFGKDPYIVRADTQDLLPVCLEQPAQLGANLIADAAGALLLCPPPIIFADFGTATSIGVIASDGSYRGGVILPGVHSALNALLGSTAQIPNVRPDAVPKSLGRDSQESLTGGMIFGNAGMTDRIIDLCEEELGTETHRIMTGRHASLIVPYLKHSVIFDEYLALKGLSRLWYAQEGGRK